MKINHEQMPSPPYEQLKQIPTGSVVTLKIRLSRDMSTEDPFLVIDMQGYQLYASEFECSSYKVAVVNLKNNRLSYINGNRQVLKLNAEVAIL